MADPNLTYCLVWYEQKQFEWGWLKWTDGTRDERIHHLIVKRIVFHSSINIECTDTSFENNSSSDAMIIDLEYYIIGVNGDYDDGVGCQQPHLYFQYRIRISCFQRILKIPVDSDP